MVISRHTMSNSATIRGSKMLANMGYTTRGKRVIHDTKHDRDNMSHSLQHPTDYRKVSNIRRTESQNWNDSHLVLKSSLLNPLKPGVKSRMKM